MDLADYIPERDLRFATTIPSRWYTDPQMLPLEAEKIFGTTWQCVGHVDQVTQPGDYFACDVVGEPVVVLRTKDGALRAMSNVCRHRASILVEGQGRAQSLRCPYHGWTYGLDGRLLGAPEFDGVAQWSRNRVCLPQYRVETWGPLVFVNLDPNAAPLRAIWGKIPEEAAQVGCLPDRVRFSARRDYVIKCNWKVYIDNYLEGYHLPAAHPSLFRELDYAKYRVETFRYYSSQIAPIRAGHGDAARRYQYTSAAESARYYWIFPNFMLNVYPDNLSTNIILPMGVDQTLTIFEWFTYAAEDGAARAVAPETIAFSDEIQQEDVKICEAVQRGLKSRTYDRGRLSVKRENGVHHFHLLLHDFLCSQEERETDSEAGHAF